MNILDGISVQRSEIIDAYTKIFGDKYRDIIENRVNRTKYLQFEDYSTIYDYCRFLEECKQKELSIKFLEKIGINIDNSEKENYFEDLTENTNNLIFKYIGGHKCISPKYNEIFKSHTGILAWKSLGENIDLKSIEAEKINFINFLRGQDKNTITKETYESFKKTDEYKQMEKQIEEYLKVYDEIAKEYDDYVKKEIEPHKRTPKEEQERVEDIRKNRANSLYEQIEEILPIRVRYFLDDNYSSIDEKRVAFLCGNHLGMKTDVEYFSQADEDKLNDSTISDNDKDIIYFYRMCYFKRMGAITEDDIYFKNRRESYEKCLKKETVQQIIIPPQIADEITKKRTKAYEEIKKEIAFTSPNFIKNTEGFEDTIENKEELYRIMERILKETTGSCAMGNDEYGVNSIIAYSTRSGSEGNLDHIILHETCHAIERTEGRLGFDNFIEKNNPYNPRKRKYERLNEIFTDMFAIEAGQYLHEKGIYLLEAKELINKNVDDINTHSIEKNLVKSFLNNYREPIIEARVSGNMNNLYNIIGEENFEELNDVVNKVDYLIYSNNLVEKLKNNQNEEPTVIEYNEQLERLNQVYANMEMHKQKQEQGKSFFKNVIELTKGKVRLGKINDWIASITKDKEKDYEQHENK